jgi:hypothetical protein
LWLLCPLLESQDYAPFLPLASVFAAASLVGRARAALLAKPLAVAVILLALLLTHVRSHRFTSATTYGQLIGDVLRLTDANDIVVDQKGETVYRRRAVRQLLETVTRQKLASGLVPDDLVEQICRAGAPVAVWPASYTGRTDVFIRTNYLPVSAQMAVCGRYISVGEIAAGQTIEFDTRVPNTYAIIDGCDRVDGILDGTPTTGPRFLSTGRHTFAPAANAHAVAILWAKAVQRGFRVTRQ